MGGELVRMCGLTHVREQPATAGGAQRPCQAEPQACAITGISHQLRNTHRWPASWLTTGALESGPRNHLKRNKILSQLPVHKKTVAQTLTSWGLNSTIQANTRGLVLN